MGRSAGLFSTGPGDVVAEVRRRVSLSDVVGRCTDLKPNGRAGHYVGLTGYIWLPAIFLFLDKMSEIRTLQASFIFTIALSMQFLSGHRWSHQ